MHPASDASGYTEAGTLAIGLVFIKLLNRRAWTPDLVDPLPVLEGRLSADLTSMRARSCLGDRGGLAVGTVLDGVEVGAPAWLRYGAAEACGLQRALESRGESGIRRHVRGLIGLGPGLTPSGDDLLCGLLAGLHVFGLRLPGLRSRMETSRAIVAESVGAAAHRTTALSRTLLHYAVRGVAVEPLLRVLWSLGSDHGVAGLDELLRIGHSSGSDMLTGAVIAATAVVGWEEASAPALVTPA